MTENDGMSLRLSIGDMSRMTHLSVKALRHYHDVGLLEPAEVDRYSGYRYYNAEQVARAQIIRRFRDLGMPVDEVKAVLGAPDLESRSEAIVGHLQRMQQQLDQTRETVEALRRLLDPRSAEVPVQYRSAAAIPCLAVVETVATEDSMQWWSEVFDELDHKVLDIGGGRAGPGGVLFPTEFFEVEKAELVAYVPLDTLPDRGAGRCEPYEVPAAELAVAMHDGPFGEIDRTYRALGLYVTERAIGLEGPIREHYVVSARDTTDQMKHRTEVAWPVFRTGVAGAES